MNFSMAISFWCSGVGFACLVATLARQDYWTSAFNFLVFILNLALGIRSGTK